MQKWQGFSQETWSALEGTAGASPGFPRTSTARHCIWTDSMLLTAVFAALCSFHSIDRWVSTGPRTSVSCGGRPGIGRFGR